MELTSIITQANANVSIQFHALERSLRMTGCDLPIQVIPYRDALFELPKNSTWQTPSELDSWLKERRAAPGTRKYQCLTVDSFQYVDADVCFLRDPCEVLAPHNGFVASCTEWNKTFITYPTDESKAALYHRSSTWQRTMFSAGQFACDRALFADAENLKSSLADAAHIEPCLGHDTEQVGMNLLVAESGVAVTNLTLPPFNMESTWAGDYPGEYEHLWQDAQRKPYLIHWAGPVLEWDRPINDIFYSFLTRAERAEWDEQVRVQIAHKRLRYEKSLPLVRRLARRGLRLAGLRP